IKVLGAFVIFASAEGDNPLFVPSRPVFRVSKAQVFALLLRLVLLRGVVAWCSGPRWKICASGGV
uniref:Uncharacterized protein n=1 Tax=Parascaris univalens TaxID=6257 RepID=A0A915A9Z6_PARUN